jgi:hypothetical protein
MPSHSPMPSHPIDVVITWVDGDDPAHKAKRLRYLLPQADQLHENGINPHRWACSDELSYCLRSIENHAPWVGTIFIVSDDQIPDLSHLSAWLRGKIKMIDHRAIFVGFEHFLPTFNSLAIESLLWRIDGLAEHFIYFNDDVFLTSRLRPTDVFDRQQPVLRGKWVDHSTLGANPDDLADPTLFHDFMQLQSAELLGFDRSRIFASAHVVHPMTVSVFSNLFEHFKPAFEANISHRFRDVSQFQPQGLHNCACLQAGTFSLVDEPDYLHLRTGAVEDFSLNEVEAYLIRALNPDIRFLCINDLSQIEAAIPNARDVIEAAIARTRIAA